MKGEIEVSKIGTGNNMADILTKHVEAEVLGKHSRSMGIRIEEGRHMLMPAVAEQAQEGATGEGEETEGDYDDHE